MKHSSQRSTSTRQVETYTFTSQEVIAALRTTGKLPQPLPQVNGTERMSQDEEAYVQVPGGGDWANCRLDLDDHPLVVKVTTETDS